MISFTFLVSFVTLWICSQASQQDYYNDVLLYPLSGPNIVMFTTEHGYTQYSYGYNEFRYVNTQDSSSDPTVAADFKSFGYASITQLTAAEASDAVWTYCLDADGIASDCASNPYGLNMDSYSNFAAIPPYCNSYYVQPSCEPFSYGSTVSDTPSTGYYYFGFQNLCNSTNGGVSIYTVAIGSGTLSSPLSCPPSSAPTLRPTFNPTATITFPPTTPPPNDDNSSSALSGGAIAGICIGAVVFVGLLIAVAMMITGKYSVASLLGFSNDTNDLSLPLNRAAK